MDQARFLDQAPPFDLFVGKGKAMRRILTTLKTVASTDVPILIQGESGTGKELCVEWLHKFQNNTSGSLVKVSCPAIPQALLESELFGYERGAFTGANKTRSGRVEQAEGGILFMDEIGDLDLGTQVKLLRFLQDQTFSRVGGHELRQVKTRLVCTANRDLQEQVAEGRFRLDLLYRINAVTLTLPPLRDRKEDIPDIIEYFLAQHSAAFKTRPPAIPQNILRALTQYSWPGNFRQLANMIRSFALLGTLDVLVPEEAFQSRKSLVDIDMSKPSSLKAITREATQQLERQIILGALRANGWNRRKTANWLKISYRSLLYKLEAFSNLAPEVALPQTPPSAEGSMENKGPQLRLD